MRIPSRNVLRKLYVMMLKIRRAQEKIAEIYPQIPRKIQMPVHLCTGHEAIPAGVCANLLPGDRVYAPLRNHGHYLAIGGDLKALFAELYGKETGCSHGKGGSMNLTDINRGFFTSGIVAGCIPVAVGSSLAFKMRGEKKVVACFFGDSACEEGIWHESMNFAALKKLPIVFICENNFYAVKSHIPARQAKDNIYQRAENYGMPGTRIDGNDVLKVFQTAKKFIERARRGEGPALVEARTYRWRQHCENTFFNPDLLEGRPKDEYGAWFKRCPIKLYENYLLRTKVLRRSDLEKISSEIDREIDEAIHFAEESSLPNSLNPVNKEKSFPDEFLGDLRCGY
jgi:TPP-dependent pyruvate/acetoin dehydrogenase alpha subunit